MAEMTAQEAKDLLTTKADVPQDIKKSPFFNLYLRISVDNARQIVAVIEQQQQQIEQQAAEIAKKDRMISNALSLLSMEGREVVCPAMRCYWDNGCDFGCNVRSKHITCWLAWLEKEAQWVE